MSEKRRCVMRLYHGSNVVIEVLRIDQKIEKRLGTA